MRTYKKTSIYENEVTSIESIILEKNLNQQEAENFFFINPQYSFIITPYKKNQFRVYYKNPFEKGTILQNIIARNINKLGTYSLRHGREDHEVDSLESYQEEFKNYLIKFQTKPSFDVNVSHDNSQKDRYLDVLHEFSIYPECMQVKGNYSMFRFPNDSAIKIDEGTKDERVLFGNRINKNLLEKESQCILAECPYTYKGDSNFWETICKEKYSILDLTNQNDRGIDDSNDLYYPTEGNETLIRDGIEISLLQPKNTTPSNTNYLCKIFFIK